MVHRVRFLALLGSFLLCLAPCSALASIHTWDVSEVFSNADGTIQFVELKENGNGNNEGNVSNGSIASTTAGNFSWAGNPPNPPLSNTLNKYYLIATQSFANLPGAPTPDVIMPPGFLPFFNVNGDTVSFQAWDSCTFGAVPDNGVGSYDCISDAPQAANSPTNFAGGTGSVDASAITLNQVDDFQSGTLENWAGNSLPMNIATGGPAGAGDRYLQISATNSNLGSFNKTQWSGNYSSAGVNQLKFDLKNFGPNAVSVRIMVFTPGCETTLGTCTAWTSTVAQTVAAGPAWVPATFSLAEANLTRVFGSATYAATLANVERLLIRHDDGTPTQPGISVPVTATLGIDNVMPEPSGWAGVVAGAALLGILRRSRRESRN